MQDGNFQYYYYLLYFWSLFDYHPVFRYEPYLGNLSVNVWQFTGDKKDTLCKAKEMSAKLKEACSLYQKYAKKLIS